MKINKFIVLILILFFNIKAAQEAPHENTSVKPSDSIQEYIALDVPVNFN